MGGTSVGLVLHHCCDYLSLDAATLGLMTSGVAIAIEGANTGRLPATRLTRECIVGELPPATWVRDGDAWVAEIGATRAVFVGDQRWWGELLSTLIRGLREGTAPPTRGVHGGAYTACPRNQSVSGDA